MRERYRIEVRDINGNRRTTKFNSLDEFYYWAVAMSLSEASEELEILRVELLHYWGSQQLFCWLGNEPIDWEDLVSYLA